MSNRHSSPVTLPDPSLNPSFPQACAISFSEKGLNVANVPFVDTPPDSRSRNDASVREEVFDGGFVVIVREEEEEEDGGCVRGRCVVAVVDDQVTGVTRKLADCKVDSDKGVGGLRLAASSKTGVSAFAVSSERRDAYADADTAAVSGARRDADVNELQMRMGEYIPEQEDVSSARAALRNDGITVGLGHQRESRYFGRSEAQNLFVASVAAGRGGGGWQGCERGVVGGDGGGGEWGGDEKWDMLGMQFVATGGDDCDHEGEGSGCSIGHDADGQNYYLYAEQAPGGHHRSAVGESGKGRFAGLC